MDFTIDWAKFGELVVPGVVVGVFMLFAQLGAELYREKRRLIAEEGWLAKKDAFSSAILLVDQHLTSTTTWSGPDVPKDHKPSGAAPSSLEINSVYAQLMLTAESPDIPRRFVTFFMKGHNSSPATRGEFIILLRKELFSSKTSIKPEEVPWVF